MIVVAAGGVGMKTDDEPIVLQAHDLAACTLNTRDYNMACRCASTLRASAGKL